MQISHTRSTLACVTARYEQHLRFIVLSLAISVFILSTACTGCDGQKSDTIEQEELCPECPVTCTDGVLNGDEESKDCGGSCLGCDDGSRPPQSSPIKQYTAQFMMPVERNSCSTLHRPHSQRRWSVFTAGRCSGCFIPSRISSAAFGNTLIVSWAASAAYDGLDDPNNARYGHLSTFTFTERDGFNKINDFYYEGCTFDMGSVTTSPDGSVIGALCVAHDASKIKGDFIDQKPGPEPEPKAQKDLFLFEWTGGKITQTPDKIVRISRVAGGWNYGHWDLSLNNDLTHYYVEEKATGGGHETELHYAIDRQDDYKLLRKKWTDGSNCGSGHTISNRITHNKHDDTWSVFCGLDSGRKMRWHPVPNQQYEAKRDDPRLGLKAGRRASIVTIGQFSTPGEIGVAAGGVANLISLGDRGWLATALGPFDILDGTTKRDERPPLLVNQQIGFRRLPLTIKEFVDNEKDYPWHWVDLNTVCKPTKGRERRVGMVQIHNWGKGGEGSGQMLLGYSPSMQFPGKTNEYHVVEVDDRGTFLHDPVLLNNGGWGIDSLGTYMPASGCVVFPHTWLSTEEDAGPSKNYPRHDHDVSTRSKYLKFTAICPTKSPRRKSGGACRTQRSLASPPQNIEASGVEAKCPSP